MSDEPAAASRTSGRRAVTSVLLFWVGYVAITLAVGFATAKSISSEVWQLTAWGFISSAALIVLSRFMNRGEKNQGSTLDLATHASLLKRFSVGLLLGAASFGVHLAVVATFAGPIRFEWVPGVGALAAAIYFARFLSTSCMEELGFRGFALQRLASKMGPWVAVFLTAVAFGLSHLLYGWELYTIAVGVVPCGLLWGMSAIATRGLAVPIGLHAAWNFASWFAGSRAEVGPLSMIVEDADLEQTHAVGTASYLAISGALTLAFWLVHRRNVRRPN